MQLKSAVSGVLYFALLTLQSTVYGYECRPVSARDKAELDAIYAANGPRGVFQIEAWSLYRRSYQPNEGVLHINEVQGLAKICDTRHVGRKKDTFCFPWTYGTPPFVYITDLDGAPANAFLSYGPIGSGRGSVGLNCR